MAASRFQEASSSTSRSSYHDIFLSFGGKGDTQKSFKENLLYTAFDSPRFRNFRDDDEIELQKGIKTTWTSITFLPKNNAASTSCLDEEVMIIQYRDASGLSVFPVLYDVRRQKTSVKEAFMRLQRIIEVESGERREELMSKVEEWEEEVGEIDLRDDLIYIQAIAEQFCITKELGFELVAYLTGGYIQSRTDRSICIRVIVEQVQETLIRTTLDNGLKQVANLPGGYFQSRTQRKRTQNGKGTSSDLISLETLQQHFGSKRKDVADSLGISISTLKRVSRFRGIPRWPHPKRKNAVSGHSDPHRQENPSPTFNVPSTNGQIAMENEMGGPSLEPTVYNETTTAWGSSQCVFQLEGQTTQSTAYPKHNVLLIPQPQIASTEVPNENIGGSENWRDLLASQAEATPSQALASVPMIPHFMSHLTMGSPKAFHLENEMGGLIPEPNEFLPDSFELTSFENTLNGLMADIDFPDSFPDVYNETTTAWGSSLCVFQLEGQTTQSTAYPKHNVLLIPQPQIASTEVPNENIGGSENWRDLLASQAEATPSQALASVPMIPHFMSHLTMGSPKAFHLENEMGGLIPEPNEFLPDSFELTSFENTLNGLMADIDFPDSFPDVYNETTTAWGSSQCVFQLEGQTTQSTAYPKHNVLLIPQPQIASTEVPNENIGGSENRRDLLASQAEATPSQALASVPMIPHFMSHLTMGSPKAFHLENEMGGLIPEPNEFLPDSFELTSFENTLNGFVVDIDYLDSFPGNYHNDNFGFSSVHNGTEAARGSGGPNELVDPHPQAASTQIPSEIMGSLEDQSNFSAPQEEPLMGHVFGSVNGTVHSSSETALSQQPMATIPDAMLTISDKTPTILMMPDAMLTMSLEDTRSVTLKLTYGQEKIRFLFPLMFGIIELKEQVKKRLKTKLKKLDLDSFDVKYKDEDGDLILFGCDEDLRGHLQLFSNQDVVSLLVVDSDANTLNSR